MSIKEIKAALHAHATGSNDRVAISYRFVRDKDWSKDRLASEWRVCITLTVPKPSILDLAFTTHRTASGKITPSATGTTDAFAGALGVDINIDHIAYAMIDKHGNPIRGVSGRIDLPLRGRNSGHRSDLIGKAIKKLVNIARMHRLPIVMEKLDFKRKKQELADQGPGYVRMLSSFSYSEIQTTLRRRAARLGVELVDVNPAYTSVIGRVNYAARYGLSVHVSAVVSIARRTARFSERVNYAQGFRGRRNTFPTKNNESRKHVWRQWGKVRKDLTARTKEGAGPAAPHVNSRSSRAEAYALVPGGVRTKVPDGDWIPWIS